MPSQAPVCRRENTSKGGIGDKGARAHLPNGHRSSIAIVTRSGRSGRSSAPVFGSTARPAWRVGQQVQLAVSGIQLGFRIQSVKHDSPDSRRGGISPSAPSPTPSGRAVPRSEILSKGKHKKIMTRSLRALGLVSHTRRRSFRSLRTPAALLDVRQDEHARNSRRFIHSIHRTRWSRCLWSRRV